MNIKDLVATGANIALTIYLQDLIEFHRVVVADTKRELEQEIVENKSERYIDRKRTRELLDVDDTTLWRWNKRGYLKCVKVGGKVRYAMSDIKRILNGGR
jgi:Predicted site-specific integrase-resolvase